jgi:hypothetical protein
LADEARRLDVLLSAERSFRRLRLEDESERLTAGGEAAAGVGEALRLAVPEDVWRFVRLACGALRCVLLACVRFCCGDVARRVLRCAKSPR